MAARFEVKLIKRKGGSTIMVEVMAVTQSEAKATAEHQYPEYKALTAKRL